jgi:transposase
MTTTATHNGHHTTPERVLFVAFALREKLWKLGCTTGHGQTPRERRIAACNQRRVLQEGAPAKKRCGLPDTALVVRCSEAGRAGFWLHRFLQAQGTTNPVVESSALEVNRRQRRAQSDGLDVRQLVTMLRRFHHGARAVGHGVHGPSIEAEEQRHRHRALATLQQERASTTTRIQGLLRSQGIRLTSLSQLPDPLEALRLWDGAPIPRGLRQRVRRVSAHHAFLKKIAVIPPPLHRPKRMLHPLLPLLHHLRTPPHTLCHLFQELLIDPPRHPPPPFPARALLLERTAAAGWRRRRAAVPPRLDRVKAQREQRAGRTLVCLRGLVIPDIILAAEPQLLMG